MILYLRTKNYAWIAALIIPGILFGVTTFLALNNYLSAQNFLHLMFFSIFWLLLCSAVVLYKFSKPPRWHFTESEFIAATLFGRRIFQRYEVKGVFLGATDRYRNGLYSYTSYSICLKIDSANYAKDHYPIMGIESVDSEKNSLGANRFPTLVNGQNEAWQIAEIIARHWKIPHGI